MIPIGAPFGLCGSDCEPSDDGVCPESKTDAGHECGMYTWFVDLHIGKSDRCWPSTSDRRGTFVSDVFSGDVTVTTHVNKSRCPAPLKIA